MKPKKITVLYAVIACLFVLSGFACSPTGSYVGKYQAIDITENVQKEIDIELMENGEGSWTCCDGEVLFTWYVKKNELRINTKEGGIMVGKLKDQSFTITLPGKKILTFVKIPLS